MKPRILFFLPLAVLAASCSTDKVKVGGRLVGLGGDPLLLEEISPSGARVTDTVKVDGKGNFQFKVSLEDGQPGLYNLRHGSDRITLLLEAGERVKVNSVVPISGNYVVEGSQGSARLHRLSEILDRGALRLDSLLRAYSNAAPVVKESVGKDYTVEYFRIKREHLEFIMNNAGNLAGVYALYQRLPGDKALFNGESDIIYFRAVADSVSKTYPASPFVKALREAVDAVDEGAMLSESLSVTPASDLPFPEIEMNDMYGVAHRLSDLRGKVILLDFWTAEEAENRMLNAELKDIYSRYVGRGFEVYQVCVDNDRTQWVQTVQAQRLPWVNVWDKRGNGTHAVFVYNVKSVPANFLISREGKIIARNVYGEELEKRLETLLKK